MLEYAVPFWRVTDLHAASSLTVTSWNPFSTRYGMTFFDASAVASYRSCMSTMSPELTFPAIAEYVLEAFRVAQSLVSMDQSISGIPTFAFTVSLYPPPGGRITTGETPMTFLTAEFVLLISEFMVDTDTDVSISL